MDLMFICVCPPEQKRILKGDPHAKLDLKRLCGRDLEVIEYVPALIFSGYVDGLLLWLAVRLELMSAEKHYCNSTLELVTVCLKQSFVPECYNCLCSCVKKFV